jgi:hypothetical protein
MPNYGFVRDIENAHDFQTYRRAGIDTILLNPDDPGFEKGWAAAQQAGGGNYGIWIPSKTGVSPESYAQRAAQLSSKYHPSVLVPDIEFEGKGGVGSEGWNWNARAAQLVRQLAPNQRLAVSTSYGVTPSPEEFNYGAWLRAGATGFLPQTYGEKLSDQFDPNLAVQSLLRAGIPANMISTILAPGQRPVAGVGYGAYALDDFNAQTLAMLGQPGAAGYTIPAAGGVAPVGQAPFVPSGPVQLGGRQFIRVAAPVVTPAAIQRALTG